MCFPALEVWPDVAAVVGQFGLNEGEGSSPPVVGAAPGVGAALCLPWAPVGAGRPEPDPRWGGLSVEKVLLVRASQLRPLVVQGGG